MRGQIISRLIVASLVLMATVPSPSVLGEETDKLQQEWLQKFWKEHYDALKQYYSELSTPDIDVPLPEGIPEQAAPCSH